MTIASLSTIYAKSNYDALSGIIPSIKNYEYRNDSVFLSVDLDLNDIDISTRKSVIITPQIFNTIDNIIELPTVVIRGHNNSKVYRRNTALKNRDRLDSYQEVYKKPYEIIDYYGDDIRTLKKNNGIISYQYAMPYQTWMVDSKIIFTGETYGCCSLEDNGIYTPETNNLLDVGKILTVDAYNVIPQISLIKPEKVAVKRRDIKYSSALVFKVNSSYIDPTLANNRKELNSIDNIIDSVISDSDYTITAVNIIGYASPEGSLSLNQSLSERRAHALEGILKKEYPMISSRLYNVSFGGENWNALIPLVEADNMDYKYEVLDILKNVSIEDGRETKLMRLNGGKPYRYLLTNLYPLVRLVVVDVEFNVDAYDLDRIKEVINVKPQNLSLEEMYRLSETYDVNSDEFLNIFLTAVKLYPDDEVALNNALVTDINKGDIVGASKLIPRISDDSQSSEVLNSLGAYYLIAENYEKANELLTKASSMGSDNAKYNLQQMEIKLDNISKIKESEELRIKIYGD